jgi:fermentation-respiration switch protein FrsA (DUF1100 family)
MPRIGLVLLAVVLAGVGLLWMLQRRLIYIPDSGSPAPAAEVVGPTARQVELRTEDGLTLGAWLVRPTGPDRDTYVLLAAGNAGHREYRAPLVGRLAAEGFTVLLFDYRGFGGNPGSPSEPGLAADARAARQFLVEQAGARPDRLLYFGESLGAAVVTGLAAEHPPAGLVLRSPFTDLAAVGQRQYPVLPVRLLLWDRFDVVGQISRIQVPTVVVYGEQDRLVPPALSVAVASAAAGPTRTVPITGAGHNDWALLAGDELVSAVVRLADQCCPPG